MIKTFSIESIIELYRTSDELLLVLDAEENVVFINISAENLFGRIKKIKEIEHFFSFNVCILNREKFFDYNPVQEALNSKILFRAETLFQVDTNLYRNLNFKSFNIDDKKIIILSDVTEKIENSELKHTIEENRKLIEKLEKENKEFSESGEKAQTFAIRAALVNKISNKIRDSFDIEEIIQTAVDEISRTLGLLQGFYSEDSSLKNPFESNVSTVSTVVIDNSTGESRAKLVAPVIYRNEVFGVLVFLHADSKKQWHAEEINLIEGIASQLASVINQAKLFNELEKQKFDLEKTLVELKQTQAQLVQSEKMASLGQLVAGVAHEINTPIGTINSNNDIFAKCAQKIKADPNSTKTYVEIFEDTIKINSEAIKRINSIVRALKNFARLDEAEYKETDIHEGIRSTLMLINHELKGKIEVIEEFGDLPLINCYPNQLNQVFMNILVNACQSIEKTGNIRIKTEKLADKVKIAVSDTGKGIPEEHLEHIFDPGFTTKGVGVGTGLGLSICYRIIQKHNGSITAESTINKGSTFIIELPQK